MSKAYGSTKYSNKINYMSNAIAQSATQLAITPNGGEQAFDFTLSVKRQADRNAKGITRERQMINRNKLVSAVCADYRMHFCAIYGKTERLPSEVFESIEKAVDSHLDMVFSNINRNNVISYRRAFFHNAKDLEITERVNLTGENKLSLQEQHLGVVCFITQAEKRLKQLEAKPTPDYDREKAVKSTLVKLNTTKQFIEAEIAHQAKLINEQKSSAEQGK